MLHIPWRLLLFGLFLAAQCMLVQAQPYSRHFDGVLGTSMDVTILETSASEAKSAVDQLVERVAELERIFSTYMPDSEVMRLNVERSLMLSPELQEVLAACRHWHDVSEGAFSCRLGQVMALWDEAEKRQEVPDRIAVRSLAWEANHADFDIERSPISLPDSVAIEPSGLAKGYIIQQGSELLQRLLPDKVFKLDIGGDAVYVGMPSGKNGWQVAVADPWADIDNGSFVSTLQLSDKAIAASGHESRAREIGRRRFSHILTPRDGWPVMNAPAAIVVADDALSADAIATALSVKDIGDGIDWVNTMPGVEAMVISENGLQFTSEHWQALVDADNTGTPSAALMTVDYVIPDIEVASYHSPYVAIWVTDQDNKTVKHLLLLGESQRWARENGRWWRRVGRRNPELLDGVARPTRPPGAYRLEWDGRDDFGETVSAGDYVLHMEASRELGEHDYRNIDITLGQADVIALERDGELGEVTITIQP